jgi:hypothetical protein
MAQHKADFISHRNARDFDWCVSRETGVFLLPELAIGWLFGNQELAGAQNPD